MAYRYRRRYRKRGYRRRRVAWYNRKYSVAQLASKALKGVRYLKGLVNSEKFKHDLIGSGTHINTGTMTHLTGIAIGDGDGQRTGNSIFVRNVSIRGALIRPGPPAFTAMDVRVRMMLLIDKQQVGDTAPTPADVLASTGTSNSVYSHLNPATVGRFTILRSRLYALTEDNPTIPINWNVNLRHHVRYNGSTGTDIQRGGIYLLIITTAPSGNGAAFDRAIRVSYHDN